MPYDASHDQYLDTDTGVLKNKLGVINSDELSTAEAAITSVIIATLELPPAFTLKDFSKSLFLEMHQEIFSDIYGWAGETRTIDIGKQASYFAHAAYIHSSLDVIFNELCSDKRLTSTDKTTFVKAITYYHAEINAVHPFREGNGRVLRTFLRLMAEQLGWDIDWSDLDPDQNIEAAAQAMFHEPKLLYDIIFNRTSRSL